MRDIIGEILLIAMTIAETVRSIRDMRDFIRHRRATRAATRSKLVTKQAFRLHSRCLEYVAIGGLAAIPVLYYGEHAILPWIAASTMTS